MAAFCYLNLRLLKDSLTKLRERILRELKLIILILMSQHIEAKYGIIPYTESCMKARENALLIS